MMGELPVATLADEIETPGTGQVRALVTIAGNPALTTPDSGRLESLLAELDLMISIDPYLNATTRHAHVILPPPSVLEKSHYDLAFTALSVRDVAHFSPPVFERPTGAPSEFEILVRLAAIAAGLGAGADTDALAEATLATRIAEAVADPGSPIHGRAPDEIAADLGGRPVEERLLDLLLRTGHRGDAFGGRSDGLSLAMLEDHPHGIDFGPLGQRLPDALATASGMVELAPPQLVADLARLDRALNAVTAGGMVLVGRRQLRTANSWTQNVPVLVRGKDTCVAQLHPDDGSRLGLADGSVATVSSAAGSIDVPVELTDAVMPGVVCIPYGWGHGLPGTRQAVAAGQAGVNVNILTDASVLDARVGKRRPQRHPGHRRPGLRGATPARAGRNPPAPSLHCSEARYPLGTGALADMIGSVNVIGSGRVGSAVSARLAERGSDARRRRPGARAPLRSRPGDR